MKTTTEYNDYASKVIFAKFKDRLEPLLAEIAPDWILHHIVLNRDPDYKDMSEQCIIRLVIKPIGSARFVDSPERISQDNLKLAQNKK